MLPGYSVRGSVLASMIVVLLATLSLAAPKASHPSPTTAPVQAVATPPAKEKFHIYVLMGQSNMVGRDTRTLSQQVDNPHVLALNGDGQWVVAHEPMHVHGTGIGPGIPFAEEMLKADPTITIGLVPCAVGNTSLHRWVKGADLYERAVARTKVAEKSGILEGVLWHQGEAECSKKDRADTYADRLSKMLGDLRTDLGQPNLPIVVGQLGYYFHVTPTKYQYATVVRDAIKKVSTTVPNVGYADSTGLTDKGDHVHFNAESQKEFGARFAKAMQALK